LAVNAGILALILAIPSTEDGEDMVDAPESEGLFSAIDALLFGARETAACTGSRNIWTKRPWISKEEIGMLMDLMKEPGCAEAVSRRLGRDVAETRRLLDGMVSVGILDVCPQGYSPTIATRLYCQSLLH
jgi:hypothetical protein